MLTAFNHSFYSQRGSNSAVIKSYRNPQFLNLSLFCLKTVPGAQSTAFAALLRDSLRFWGSGLAVSPLRRTPA